uniref:Uncharacterized protein n=1 Tax=Glossina palpalis gambiensis TaxID=67801 RepID=A0A1B0AQ20_9MUSC
MFSFFFTYVVQLSFSSTEYYTGWLAGWLARWVLPQYCLTKLLSYQQLLQQPTSAEWRRFLSLNNVPPIPIEKNYNSSDNNISQLFAIDELIELLRKPIRVSSLIIWFVLISPSPPQRQFEAVAQGNRCCGSSISDPNYIMALNETHLNHCLYMYTAMY